MDRVVFLLGHIRQEILWLFGVDGCCDYMYTIVLDAKSYGVSLYPMCIHIVCANLCFFLQLSRTSSLTLWDNRALSAQL
jgi:hypothetical protein